MVSNYLKLDAMSSYRSIRRPRSEQQPINARSRRTRAGLLAAARALLEERGFEALTMATVAERAGVSRAAVYLHFASRGELIGAVFESVAETEGLEASVQLIHTAPTAVAALDAWARLEANYHVRILGVARAIEHVGRDDPDAALWRQRIKVYQIDLCRLVAQRLDTEQRLARGWTTETATHMLWALMSSEPLERLLHDSGWSPDEYAERLSRLVRAAFVAGSESHGVG
jgi:AcrR family transcriptional regulator